MESEKNYVYDVDLALALARRRGGSAAGGAQLDVEPVADEKEAPRLGPGARASAS